jgi:EmrB/QacA subfamily drug resistance transporter
VELQSGTGVELTHREVMTVLFGLLIALFLSALDATVVATALPTMAGELGGLDQLPWVLTAYLLTSTASTPLWGKFSDQFGRRLMLQLAIVWFVVTSIAAGASQSMIQLILARGLQGIGGGGLMALTFVVVADLVSPRERGRYMGYFTGTFTTASLIGPLVGGFFVDHVDWRFIFYINAPLGFVALMIVRRVLHLPFHRVKHRIDVEGAGLLVTSVVALILTMTWGGDRFAWTSGPIIGLGLLCVGTAVLFVAQERRASEPLIPMRLFRSRAVALALVASVLAGAMMMSANAFLPLFLQVVTNVSATYSGLLLAPMMVALTVGSVLSGNLATRTGRYKHFLVGGPLLAAVGLAALSRLDASSTASSVWPWMALIGFGMGLFFPMTTTHTQNALPVEDLGVGTATLTFFRNLGQTIGVGAFGAALASRIDSVLAEQLPANNTVDVESLLNTPDQIRELDDSLRIPVIDAVSQATTLVFTMAVPIALATMLLMVAMPELPLRQWSAIAGEAKPAAAAADAPPQPAS